MTVRDSFVIVRVHQTSQDQAGAKVEPSRRTTAPDRRAQAVLCRRRHQPRRPALGKIKPDSLAAHKEHNSVSRVLNYCLSKKSRLDAIMPCW